MYIQTTGGLITVLPRAEQYGIYMYMYVPVVYITFNMIIRIKPGLRVATSTITMLIFE